ncbi:hypothetical protein HYV88_02495 [Candidatus Woesearchaeota archaeon]|nr:hypothetical protein [Candidatus Woesearchaeota archaeon]
MTNTEDMGNSVFIATFGDSPINRLLDFFIVFSDFDYSLTDIASKANIGYSTLKILIKKLEKIGFVIQSRSVGKSKMYKLNTENKVVNKFINFYWDITKENIHKEKLEELTI